MTEIITPQVVRAYLAELDRALAGVSEDVRQGIVAGVAEELDGLDVAAAAVRIDSLGDPAFIAAEAGAEAATEAGARASAGAGAGPGAGATAGTPPLPTASSGIGSRRPAPTAALPRASEQRWYVVLTALLLYIGGLVVPLAGWVGGIMMLWASKLWTRNEKLVATIVPPAVGVVLFGIFAIGGSGLWWWHALVLGGLVGPILASFVIGIILSRRGWFRAG